MNFGIDGRPLENIESTLSQIPENINANEYIDLFKQLIKENTPFEYGIEKMYGESGWRTVYFARPFKSPPVVFLQGTAREGWIEDIKIDLPTTEIKTIEIPTLKLNPLVLPKIQIPQIPTNILRMSLSDLLPINPATGKRYENMPKWFFDEGGKYFDENIPPEWYKLPILGEILWSIKIISQVLAAFVGQMIERFANSYIQPTIDRIEETLMGIADSINSIIGDENTGGTVNGELSRTVDLLNDLIASIQTQIEDNYNFLVESINTNLDFAVGGLNAKAKSIELRLEEAINGSIKRLYELLQIGEKMPIVPTVVRNVTERSFEYYSSGGDYYWIAFGLR